MSQATWVIGGVFENGDAECLEHAPQIENQDKESCGVLEEVVHLSSSRSDVFISVYKSWGKEKEQESLKFSLKIYN